MFLDELDNIYKIKFKENYLQNNNRNLSFPVKGDENGSQRLFKM